MKFCTNCGTKLLDQDKFCPACGTASRDPDSIPTEQIQKVETPVQNNTETVQRTYTPFEEEEYSPKSRTAALLLNIFLGPLGAHNFYLGNAGSGFGQLILFIISIIIVVVGTINNPDSPMMALALYYLLMLILSITLLVDLIKIASGHKRDGNGLRVKYWNTSEAESYESTTSYNQNTTDSTTETSSSAPIDSEETWQKLTSVHYNKIIDRTMDRAIVKKISNSYYKLFDHYHLVEKLNPDTYEFLSEYIQQQLDNIRKLES